MLVPWIGIIFLILYLFAAGRTNPEGLLDERYAKGELTREQYLQMKDDMGKSTKKEWRLL